MNQPKQKKPRTRLQELNFDLMSAQGALNRLNYLLNKYEFLHPTNQLSLIDNIRILLLKEREAKNKLSHPS